MKISFPAKIDKNITYPGYADDAVFWKKALLTYSGGEKYINGEFLDQRAAETSNSFTKRKTRAFLINYAEMIVNTIVKYIFSMSEKFEILDGERLAAYRDDFDGEKNGIINFFKKIAPLALCTGRYFVEIRQYDLSGEIKNIAELNEAGNLFYASPVSPENVPYYSFNPNNAFAWVKENILETDAILGAKTIPQLRILTPTEIAVYRKKDEQSKEYLLTEIQTNPFGVLPIVEVHPKPDKESLIKDAWRTQRAIFNLYSDLIKCFDNLYPILAVHQDVLREAGGEVNVSKPIGFPDGESVPRWIESPVNYSDSLLKAIDVLVSELLRQVGLNSVNRPADYFIAESGRAKEIEFLSTGELLSMIASGFSAAMEKCLEIIGRAVGVVPTEISVTPPKTFSLESFTDELNRNMSILKLGAFGSSTLTKELKARIVKKLGLPQSITEQVLGELTDAPVSQGSIMDYTG